MTDHYAGPLPVGMSRFESRADRIARLEADPRFHQRADGAWLGRTLPVAPVRPAEEPEPDAPADLGALFDQEEAPEDLAAFLAS